MGEINGRYFMIKLGITALMYSDRDPSIAGIVIDSAMTDLKTLAEEICKKQINIPSFVLSGALSIVKKSVTKINLYIGLGKSKF